MAAKNTTRKVALVTGGGRRIGRGICLALAKEGYFIALHYGRSRTEAEQTALRIQKDGGVCTTFSCDLSDAHAAERLIPLVCEEFGRLDVLVNSASIFEKSSLAQGSLEIWDRHFDTNLKAPYILMRSFTQNVREGSIINLLDTHIVGRKTAHAAYLLSKKALAELTQMAAVEFAPAIRVNAVAPGFILPPVSGPARSLDHLAKRIPLQHKGNIDDVARAILFLLTNDYLTGQVIYVDGGEHLLGGREAI